MQCIRKSAAHRTETQGCWKADMGPVALTLSPTSQLFSCLSTSFWSLPSRPLEGLLATRRAGDDLGSGCPRKLGRGDWSHASAAHPWGGGSVSWSEGLGWWQSPWGSLDTSVVPSTSHSVTDAKFPEQCCGFRTVCDRIILSPVLELVMGALAKPRKSRHSWGGLLLDVQLILSLKWRY